jgi:hypothetical protein
VVSARRFKKSNFAAHQLNTIREACKTLRAPFPVQEVRLFDSFASKGTKDSELFFAL